MKASIMLPTSADIQEVLAAHQAKQTPARVNLLEEAIKITTQDRNSAYGNPEDNFQNIANYWNTYLTTMPGQGKILSLTSQDVAHLMILMKMARLNTNLSHRDSLVDIAGYAACGEDCRAKRVSKSAEIRKATQQLAQRYEDAMHSAGSAALTPGA